MNKEERIIDVIPIYKNEILPTKQMWWHFSILNEVPDGYLTAGLYCEIKRKFFGCDCVILVENGKVLDILKGGSNE